MTMGKLKYVKDELCPEDCGSERYFLNGKWILTGSCRLGNEGRLWKASNHDQIVAAWICGNTLVESTIWKFFWEELNYTEKESTNLLGFEPLLSGNVLGCLSEQLCLRALFLGGGYKSFLSTLRLGGWVKPAGSCCLRGCAIHAEINPTHRCLYLISSALWLSFEVCHISIHPLRASTGLSPYVWRSRE